MLGATRPCFASTIIAYKIGKAEGKAEMLMRQMRHRYGALPESAVATILEAQPADLDLWADAIFEAGSLDGLLSRRAGA
jgi:ABC-type cobalt transport system substrate-binding protein